MKFLNTSKIHLRYNYFINSSFPKTLRNLEQFKKNRREFFYAAGHHHQQLESKKKNHLEMWKDGGEMFFN